MALVARGWYAASFGGEHMGLVEEERGGRRGGGVPRWFGNTGAYSNGERRPRSRVLGPSQDVRHVPEGKKEQPRALQGFNLALGTDPIEATVCLAAGFAHVGPCPERRGHDALSR